MLALLQMQLKEMYRVFVLTMRYGAEIHWPKPEENFRKYNLYKVPFDGQSLAGFKIKYQLTIETEPETPVLPHIEIPLISKLERDTLFKVFNEKFLQLMKETNRYFHFVNANGHCRIIRLTADGEIKTDPNCSDTIREFQQSEFIGQGCRARLLAIDAWIDRDDATLIKENYSMIDDSIGNLLREQIGTRKVEEAWIVTLLNERLKVQEAWKKHLYFGSNRTYKGKLFSLQTESLGNEVVIKWKFNDSKNNQRFHMRGFRRYDPFPLDTEDRAQGVLVIDRWGDDWVTEHLGAGRTFYYTLKVSRKQLKWDFLSMKEFEVEQEIFRFEFTTLPEECADNFEQKLSKWIEKIRTPQLALPAPLSPERKKINQLVEYLDSFVEFDDALTQREKVLIKEMEGKNYSPKERKDKIERLKLVVEDLRQKNS
jgi:hypothetical protein